MQIMWEENIITNVLHCTFCYNFYSGSLRWNFIQSGTLNCGWEKVLHLQNAKNLMRLLVLEKPELSSSIDLMTIKANRISEMHIEKYSVNFLTTIIALLHCTKNEEILNGKLNLCAVLGIQKLILFEQCETHKHLKKEETFWQHPLKTFYPLDRNEKQEYLYQHT